jgi:hypothetical protein
MIIYNLSGDKLLETDTLSGANLRGANLCEADLRGANLYEADLRGANLRGANLCEADLRGANLREADLREADLYEADLREANLYEAKNAPLVIHWLRWTAYIYEDNCIIGCKIIMRDNPTLDGYSDLFEKFLPTLQGIWDTVFPRG